MAEESQQPDDEPGTRQLTAEWPDGSFRATFHASDNGDAGGSVMARDGKQLASMLVSADDAVIHVYDDQGRTRATVYVDDQRAHILIRDQFGRPVAVVQGAIDLDQNQGR